MGDVCVLSTKIQKNPKKLVVLCERRGGPFFILLVVYQENDQTPSE